MTMTLYEYRTLSFQERSDVLHASGVLLSDRSCPPYHLSLFQLYSFYVEVYFHQGHQHIDSLRPFNSMQLLDPYLEQIDVSGLIPE